MLKNKYLLILISLSVAFLQDFNSEFNEAHSFQPKFVKANHSENDFGIQIDVQINDGYYMLSTKNTSFKTQIIWPEKGACTNENGEDFVYYTDEESGEQFYCSNERQHAESCCIEEGGIYNYGKWIKSQTEMMENQVPYNKGTPEFPLYIQKGEVQINQEFALLDNLMNDEYLFESSFEYQICADEGMCMIYSVSAKNAPKLNQKIKISKDANNEYLLDWAEKDAVLEKKDVKNENCELTKSEEDSSLIASFFTAILAGLIAIITPCVFPMIPMTVAFFSKDAKKGSKESIKTGVLFGISIIAIFTIVGVLFSAIFGAQLANELATSAIANIIFPLILFALMARDLLACSIDSSNFPCLKFASDNPSSPKLSISSSEVAKTFS